MHMFPGQLSLEAEKTWLQCECDRWGNKFKLEGEETILNITLYNNFNILIYKI